MKRLSAILLVLVTVFAVCSCKSGGDGESLPKKPQASQKLPPVQSTQPEKQEPEEDIEALANEAIEKMSKIPEYPEGFPTLDDVVDQYKKAERVAGWLLNTTSVLADPEDSVEKHGLSYFRVLPLCHYESDYLVSFQGKPEELDKLIYNKRSLEAYFATLIDPADAHEFIVDIDAVDVPRFIEGENGALYVLPYSMAASGYGDDDSYELSANDDGSYTFTVHYTLLDEKGNVRANRSRDFEYANIDGRWVFKNFVLIKQH